MSDQRINPTGIDAYAPVEIAARIETAGVTKARLDAFKTLILASLAGAFIAFGGMLFTLVMTEHGLGLGPSRLLGGVAFSLGLILVVIAGAELFTGNNLIVMAWADGKVTFLEMMRNWGLVFVGNIAGSIAMAILVVASGTLDIGAGAVAKTAMGIASAKVQIPAAEAFYRGVLCNTLVCLAVWLCFAAHTVPGKIMAIVPPIAAFVALGFEHSIANAYLMPVGYMMGAEGVTISAMIGNLFPVTLGNIVGGSVFVALVYWMVYGRAGN